MSTPLLATKLYIPPVRPEWVPRRQLVERLNAGLGHCPPGFARKLTLISAPAGSGKTTLVTTWLSDQRTRIPDCRLGWLSLDEGDSDPLRFFSYLVAALRAVDPQFGQETLRLLERTQLPPA